MAQVLQWLRVRRFGLSKDGTQSYRTPAAIDLWSTIGQINGNRQTYQPSLIRYLGKLCTWTILKEVIMYFCLGSKHNNRLIFLGKLLCLPVDKLRKLTARLDCIVCCETSTEDSPAGFDYLGYPFSLFSRDAIYTMNKARGEKKEQ